MKANSIESGNRRVLPSYLAEGSFVSPRGLTRPRGWHKKQPELGRDDGNPPPSREHMADHIRRREVAGWFYGMQLANSLWTDRSRIDEAHGVRREGTAPLDRQLAKAGDGAPVSFDDGCFALGRPGLQLPFVSR